MSEIRIKKRVILDLFISIFKKNQCRTSTYPITSKNIIGSILTSDLDG